MTLKAPRGVDVPKKEKTRAAGVSGPGRGNCLRGARGKVEKLEENSLSVR